MDKRFYKGYKIHFLYNPAYAVPLAYTVTSACLHDNRQLKPLIKKLGIGILTTIGLYGDRAYDSKSNVPDMASIGTTMINRRNKRKSKNKYPRYRLQDCCKVHGNWLNHLYKTRDECEVTNSLLKERLHIEKTRTKGMIRHRVKTGLIIIARQIQVSTRWLMKKKFPDNHHKLITQQPLYKYK